jgi:ATP-binding cassette subfamily C protein EexD
VLLGLTIWNELATRDDDSGGEPPRDGVNNQTQRNLRNVEVIEAMGMLPRMRERWQRRQDTMLALQSGASRRAGVITSASRTFRLTVQTLVLGLGAYLALRRRSVPAW